MSISEIGLYTRQNCQPYEENWFTQWLVLTRYISAAITLSLFVFGLRNRELYLSLFSVWLLADSLLNQVLQQVFRVPVPVPGCGGPYGMPSFQVQHSACFVTFILLYGFIWPSGRHGYSLYTGGLVAWLGVVAYAHVFFNYNTPAQVFVATAVGAVMAGLGQFLIWCFAWPAFPTLLQWRIFSWRGYQDTLCSYCVTDIVPTAKATATPTKTA